MSQTFNENTVEEAALSWFDELGYSTLHGQDIAPGEPGAERQSYNDVVLMGRLRDAIDELNPDIPELAREEALRKVLNPESPALIVNNRAFHKMLRDGVEVEYNRPDGSIAGDRVRLVSDDPSENDFLAVRQFTVVEGHHNRRPDVVVFLNGLPICVIELKAALSEDATIWSAWNQLQTYKDQIPSLFVYNEVLCISDGLNARTGSLTAGKEWFKPWRSIEGENEAPPTMTELEVLIRGVFDKERLLILLKNFIAFEEDTDSDEVYKILAQYHQFYAVEKAVGATVQASSEAGDRRCGVVWHTQGSGKSLSMTFYAGRMVSHPAMENPTLVVLTDRNDLDDQLFGQFSRCYELMRQHPQQSENRGQLQELLKVASGGVVFTTIQKFFPETKGEDYPMLSDRRNIVVIADEAHRSQYDMIDGYARHMRDALPKASFIGFTGTPIELGDKNTRGVFGDYIDIYDIEQAVKDQATVPIYYESRIAKLELDESLLPKLDPEFEELTEGEEESKKEKLKTKWAALEALVGSDKRIKLIADDLIQHWEKRLEAMDGKAMIVCMSRRIAVDLYNALIELRPEWHSEDDDKGVLKVVMTGSASDPLEWQTHIRNKPRRKELAKRFKDPESEFKIVIVRDMWLTGFDAPCLTTMYADKPMRGHGLMQAIARVNRVFKDKPGGLIVDYLGIADQLKLAMNTYTQSGGKGAPAVDTEEAVAVMLEKYEVCCDMLHGFDWSLWHSEKSAERLTLLPQAQQHILEADPDDGKSRFNRTVYDLSRAYALCPAHDEAERIRDDIAFFQAVRSAFLKTSGGEKDPAELDHAIRQLVSKAVSAGDEVIDVFSAAGLKRPDISILDDEFLAEVQHLPQKNLAVELLKKLLKGEIKTRRKKNVVQSRSFAEMLESSLKQYHKRAITTQEMIDQLIEMAKDMREAESRGEKLGLNEDESAFYDALAANESAVDVMGDKQLAVIAHELLTTVKKNATIDWTIKETVRAKMRVVVRRILRKYGYPPDLQDAATQTVLEQAETLCAEWVG
ncbi:MAG: type I restriction endonuclease subunit R [Planctomycetaceae bacterium]|nr:type I restriction endonuclease subunit R [Planctomycetaceae bacterium]